MCREVFNKSAFFLKGFLNYKAELNKLSAVFCICKKAILRLNTEDLPEETRLKRLCKLKTRLKL